MRTKMIEDYFNVLFMKQALTNKKGLVHLFSQMADAEGGNSGELHMFDKLHHYVTDPAIKKIIEVHKKDEEKHEQMFLDYISILGENPIPLTDDLRLLKVLDLELNILSKDVQSDQDVVNLMTLLLVIEERAIFEFENLLKVFEKDLAIRSMLEEAIKDEQKHLKFCYKIINHYETDKLKIEKQIKNYRHLEDIAYRKLSLNQMNYYLKENYIKGDCRQKFWKFLGRIAQNEIQREPGQEKWQPMSA